MANIGFSLLEEPETRKPSKVRLLLLILFVLPLILAIVFITLYVVDKTKSRSPQSERVRSQGSETKPTLKPSSATTSKATTRKSTTRKSATRKSTTRKSTTSKTCVSSTCVVSAAAILNKLNQSTKPCDDFYEFSCGGFLKKTHLEEDDYQKGGDTAAIENILYSLKDIMENEQMISKNSVESNSAVHKAFTFYKSCMDETDITSDGNEPVLDVIRKYGSWSITDTNWDEDSWSLEKTLARMAVDLKTYAFLFLDIRRSPFDTSKVYISIMEGLSAHDRRLTEYDKKRPSRPTTEGFNDFDFDFDSHEHYRTFMTTVFKLLGAESFLLDDEVKKIDELEDNFAEMRDFKRPQPEELHKFVNFMTLEKLNAFTSFKFDWTKYLKEVFRDTGKSIRSDTKLMMVKPDITKKIIDFITSQPKRVLANAIMWNAIRGLIHTLPKSFRDAYDQYRKNKYGLNPPERWKTCIVLTDKAFTYVSTLLYVNKHVPKDALKTASEMFTEIKNQFVDGLKELKWMDDETRTQARLKLKRMKENIGYPSFIKDQIKLNTYYENVDVNEFGLLKNQLSSFRVEGLRKLDAFGKPPDDGKFDMSPLTVNAYYNPRVNGMTILAGILQPPFYVHGRLNALNYGSLGMVVGHEITHGFDKRGSQYDENGNIRSWWTAKSHENFVKRSTCLVDQYNNVNVYGVQVDGQRTLSENIADNGGLKYAFRAYQKWRDTHGSEDKLPALSFDNDQLFFIGFAQSWCEKYRKDKVKILMEIDTHSLDPVRVRVPVHNFPEFSKAFGCSPPSPYDTCSVW